VTVALRRLALASPHRLAITAALVVQALDFGEIFPRPWGLLLSVPTLALPFSRTLWRSAGVWAAIALVDLGSIVTRPLFLPNHHFLIFYVALMLALAGTDPRRPAAITARNAQLVLAAVMGLAAVQKLLSPSYVDYMGYMMATGGFGEPLLVRIDSLASAVGRNSAEAARFLATPPAASAALQLRVPGSFRLVAAVAAALVVALEGYLALMALARPASRGFHLGLLGFLALLGFIRSELVFLCALAALGLLLSSDRPSPWRWAYLSLLAVATPLAAALLLLR
jgi:hypothetical protein